MRIHTRSGLSALLVGATLLAAGCGATRSTQPPSSRTASASTAVSRPGATRELPGPLPGLTPFPRTPGLGETGIAGPADEALENYEKKIESVRGSSKKQQVWVEALQRRMRLASLDRLEYRTQSIARLLTWADGLDATTFQEHRRDIALEVRLRVGITPRIRRLFDVLDQSHQEPSTRKASMSKIRRNLGRRNPPDLEERLAAIDTLLQEAGTMADDEYERQRDALATRLWELNKAPAVARREQAPTASPPGAASPSPPDADL